MVSMKMSKPLIGWKLHMQSGRYSNVTIDSYINTMQKVIKHLGDPDAGDVPVWHLEEYLMSLRDLIFTKWWRYLHAKKVAGTQVALHGTALSAAV